MPVPALLIAGRPAESRTLFHRVGFSCGDPAAWIRLPDGTSTFIVRDIELARARRHARADRCVAPADVAPNSGLSADRETATAQAAAEVLRRAEVRSVHADRSLPLSFVHECRLADIEVRYDPDLGVADRRAKTDLEVDALRTAQGITERAVEMACRLIGRASARADGVLVHEGSPLTTERVRTMVHLFLMEHGCEPGPWIIAGGAHGGDCHHRGEGALRTGEAVIVDIFPRHEPTQYFGDCTRTVVHGDIPDDIRRMHACVLRAKRAAITATRAGVSVTEVHGATLQSLKADGFERALPPADHERARGFCSMQHGTGHGIGLEVHESPLLDDRGSPPFPTLVAGDALTIEPGLYKVGVGGVRVEDLVIVREGGCENLNSIGEGLEWR